MPVVDVVCNNMQHCACTVLVAYKMYNCRLLIVPVLGIVCHDACNNTVEIRCCAAL